MPKFGHKSKAQLSTCDEDLQELFNKVVEYYDCTVIEGFRNEEKQNEAYEKGNSKLKFPNGNHNSFPSTAIDVAPYPIDWKDKERFYYFGGFVMGMAAAMGIPLRFGGDWNKDGQTKDNKFDDLVHFELNYPHGYSIKYDVEED